MLSFNQFLMSSGNAAGSELRVEEQVTLIPSAWHRMKPMALPHHSYLLTSLQVTSLAVRSQVFLTSDAQYLWPPWCDFSLAKDWFIFLPLGRAQFGATFPKVLLLPHKLAKSLPDRCSQGLKVGFGSTQYSESGWAASLLHQLKLVEWDEWNCAKV